MLWLRHPVKELNRSSRVTDTDVIEEDAVEKEVDLHGEGGTRGNLVALLDAALPSDLDGLRGHEVCEVPRARTFFKLF